MPKGRVVGVVGTEEERFFRKVQESETEFDGLSCWLWTGSTHVIGYGSFRVCRATVQAHRWAYEFMVGDIPEGLSLDHLCRNRACVNPWHLEPVPHRVNVLRGNSPTALNAAKTHCIRGHELSGDNLAKTKATRRQCAVCVTQQRRAKNGRG